MEPTKLFEIFEEVAHAEQRPCEMLSRYATIKIRDLVDGAIFDAAENKGLYALDGMTTDSIISTNNYQL